MVLNNNCIGGCVLRIAVGIMIALSFLAAFALAAENYTCIDYKPEAIPPFQIDNSNKISTANLCPEGKVPKANLSETEFNIQPPKLLPNSKQETANNQIITLSVTCEFEDCFDWGQSSQSINNLGASAYLTQHNPEIDPVNGIHSLTAIAVKNEQQGHTVIVGWRRVKNDINRLFVFWYNNNQKQCYNEGCGWVQYSSSIYPGMEVSDNNVGIIYYIEYYQGNWWIRWNNEWIGYYPSNLWNMEFIQGTTVYYYGQVASTDQAGKTTTDMGNGLWASNANAARIFNEQYKDTTGSWMNANTVKTATSEERYTVQSLSSNSMSYGGPGYYIPVRNINKGTNYTTIQAAIDDASPGDEIQVDSGTYYENVNVNKQLTLRGIGMPVVNANYDGSAITLSVDGITLEGFSATEAGYYNEAGIKVNSNNNRLINNNAYSNTGLGTNFGIRLDSSSNNELIGNNVSNNNVGIDLYFSNNNRLTGNNASNNYQDGDGGGGLGISLSSSSNNILTGNIMINNEDNFGVTGSIDSHYNNNIDISNIVNGKPIYYFQSVSDKVYTTYANVGTFYCIKCNNITVRDSIFTNNLNGVFFWKTNNSKIENIDTSGNSFGIHLSSSSNNKLIGNDASNNGYTGGYGIYLDSSSNNELIGNNASNNIRYGSGMPSGDGIVLSSSNNNMLTNNNALNNGEGLGYGIVLYTSSNNELIGNNASNNENGISLYSSSINTLNGNTASNNGGYGGHGIFLSSSGNNMLINNVMKGNKYNFGLSGSFSSDFDNQININNLVDGKPIYYIIGATDIVYDSYTNAGTFYCISCVNVTTKDMNLNKNDVGVFFWNTIGSRIQNITALSNNYGFYLDTSSNNELIGNNASGNNMGVRMDSSNNNLLRGSNTSNNNYGISLSYSSNNILSGNNGSSNGKGVGYGISLRYSNNNTLTNNHASNNGLYGILLEYSSNNTLTNNVANSHPYDGIILEYSSNNKLIGNNAKSNNARGIYLYYSSNNLLYQNNLINNINYNAYDRDSNNWDNGTIGNYYSNFDESGEGCIDSNNNGICDSSYSIPGGSSVDWYPLMKPWGAARPQDKTLVQVEGQLEVYWFQNNRLYWVTSWNVINQMSGVPDWDSVNTLPPSEFNPSNYEQGPRFISTGAESDGLLIREVGDYQVYLVENGMKRHITYPDVMDLKGYSFDDVIEISSAISNMFQVGVPVGIEVDLYFNKLSDSGESPHESQFTTGDTIKFITETTVIEDYTVETYVLLTYPDGITKKYAYHENPDLSDQLKFSETERPFYPGTWHAETKTWPWNEYTFTGDETEGVYTWEFWYKDTASGKILGKDVQGYEFSITPPDPIDITPPMIILLPVLGSTTDGITYYNSNVYVSGTAFDPSGIKSININGQGLWSIPVYGVKVFGSFIYLNEGVNEITISAIDNSENSNEKVEKININYYPYNVKITSPKDGGIFKEGDPIKLEGKVIGGTPEFYYEWLINGVVENSGTSDSGLIDYPLNGLDLGDYKVKLKVTDSKGHVFETNEILIFVKPPKPDLIVTDISFSKDNQDIKEAVEGEPIIITARIKNVGPVNVNTPFWLSFDQSSHYTNYESSEIGFDALIERVRIDQLAIGESKDIKISWNAAPVKTDRYGSIRLFVDRIEEIDEIDDNNNNIKYGKIEITSRQNV